MYRHAGQHLRFGVVREPEPEHVYALRLNLQVDVEFATRTTIFMQAVLAQQVWTHYILSYDGSRL